MHEIAHHIIHTIINYLIVFPVFLRGHSTMQLSVNGLELIKQMEGFEPKVYQDSAGFDTIGYGHKLLPGESFPGGDRQGSRLTSPRAGRGHGGAISQ